MGDAAVGLAGDVAMGGLAVGTLSAALPSNPMLAGGAVAMAGELLVLLAMGMAAARALPGGGVDEALPTAGRPQDLTPSSHPAGEALAGVDDHNPTERLD